MRPGRRKSLKRRLTVQLLLFQIGSLFLLSILLLAYLSSSDEGNALISPQAAQITANAITKNENGQYVLKETEEFRRLRGTIPDFWFIALAQDNKIIQGGQVPAVFSDMEAQLLGIKLSDIRDSVLPYSYAAIARIVVVRRASGPAGEFAMIGRGDLFSMALPLVLFSNMLILPVLLFMSLVTAVAIPWIIRREFSSLLTIATTAKAIDIDKRGYRLPQDNLPSEVRPLVLAVNGVMQRLDEGYERHKRFILDAAHELRTPVAILQARVESLPEGPARSRLLADAARIAVLAEQLLDLQRLGEYKTPLEATDLVALCRAVAADMAPLAIAQGYNLAFEAVEEPVMVRADEASLQRAVMNIVQNAIEHGGNRGAIAITVRKDRVIEVCDDGSGIPEAERERIFEVFHRLRPSDRGAGLGLNLVQKIVQHHSGKVVISASPSGGACFRIELPAFL